MDATPEQHRYLETHVWGLLATGRSNGSPQLSMVGYDWDGTDIAITCRSGAVKYRNAKRHDRVVFAVPDGVDNLTITGRAICHDTGPVRDALIERIRDAFVPGEPWASGMLDADIAKGLDNAGRVVIQIVPEQIQLLQPLG